MIRRRLLAILLVHTALIAQVKPWINVDRAYRAEFDRLLTDGQIPDAETFAIAALARAEAAFGGESQETAQTLDMLLETYVYGDRVRDPAADTYAARAIAIREKLFGPEDPRIAITLRLLGDVMMARADYTRARQLFDHAVAIHRKTPLKDPRQEANALTALGTVLIKTGDFAEARTVMEEALGIRRANFPPDTLNTADEMMHYGDVLRETGDYANAESNYRAALVIFDQKLGADHVTSTWCLNGLGTLLNLMGRVKEAAPLLERTLTIEEKAYGPDHVELAFVLANLAASRAALGELTVARSHYERALGIALNVYGPDHPEVAKFLSAYAAVLLHLGDPAAARKAALRSEEIGRAHLALTIRTLPERQALLYASRRASGMDVVLTAALAEPGEPKARRAALDAVIRSRALVFDEMAARRRALSGARDPEVDRLAADLFAARQRMARLVIQGPATFRGNQYAAALTRARAENDAAGGALAERSAAFRDQTVRGAAGLDEVAARLRTGDALVSFVRHGGTESAYAAFVQRGGTGIPVMVRLGSAQSIDALVQSLRRQVQAEAEAPGVSPKRSEMLYRAAGEALRRKIWDPLEPALAGTARVFLTPDDALNLVDFGALPDRATGYLAERGPVFHYLSAERDLIPAPPTKPGKGLLAMGNPAFDQPRGVTEGAVLRGERTTCADLAAMRFEPLPASAIEVREIGAFWRGNGGSPVTERTGNAANAGAFKTGAPGKSVLHVAAHAFFAGEGCRAVAENPLLLSGLALAGGVLTAEEIAAIDLEGVEWAVLSGCATGDGKLLPGEGVFGLRRAFRVAGTRTVIMSLWPVDDESTRVWMSALYREHFAGAKSAAESVRAADLAALAKRRAGGLSTHPFYWAGFIAAGDSR